MNNIINNTHPQYINTSCFSLIRGDHNNNLHASPTMAARDPSFERILEAKPTLHELCEHVRLGTKWHLFGVLLKLDVKKLDAIAEMNNDIETKAMKMFQLWLDVNNNATRREVIKTLKIEAIGEVNVAENYVKVLTEQYDDTSKNYGHICDIV